MQSDRKPSSLGAPRTNDPDAGQGKGRPTGTSHLFTLMGLYEGGIQEPMSTFRLPLVEALTRWRHILRQEAALLQAGLGPPQVRLVRADYIREGARSNEEGQP